MQTFVGIELTQDVAPPPRYINIDHHNENSHKSSSLEQVIELLQSNFGLEIEFTRDLQLIAANDSGYIPAMLEMGATPEEVADIRNRDREAQGVTGEDEQLAEQSIRENLTIENSITVVKSLTSRFSTITDRLYPCSRILIYTNDELNYFGKGTSYLIQDFEEFVKTGKAYSGGTGEGFFGLTNDGIVSLGGIKPARKKVLEILSPETNTINSDNDRQATDVRELPKDKPLYSYHIFIFPFKWENKTTEKKPFPERFDLTKIKIKGASNWIHLPNPLTAEYATELYNEKNFFYEFVHPVLYDNEKWKDDPVVLHYERKEAYDHRELIYEIDVIANQSQCYRLNLKSIGLNLYSTGTGSLVFYLENHEYSDFDDILRINQYGRRIFPPFLSFPNGIITTKQNELANYIAITGLNGSEHRYFEDFSDFTDKTDWKPARFIESLIDDFSEELEIKPVTDDRMHVLCRYENDELSDIVKQGEWEKTGGFKNDWYRFLFVDGGKDPMCSNEKMKNKLLESHTYQRWQGEGALHGISRYSFVYLTKSNPYDFLKTHFRTIYTRMVELSLIQRASILKFSDEVTRLSKLKNENSKNITEDISGLYKAYIRFVNQIYFREVTAQEQGIELYNLLQKKMKIADQVKDLDNEISELHQYADLLERKEQDRRIAIITVLGAIFLPATFLVGLFGINTMPEGKDMPDILITGEPYLPFWISLAIILVFTALMVILINWKWKLGFKEVFKTKTNK